MEIDAGRLNQKYVSYRNNCIKMTSKRVGEKISFFERGIRMPSHQRPPTTHPETMHKRSCAAVVVGVEL